MSFSSHARSFGLTAMVFGLLVIACSSTESGPTKPSVTGYAAAVCERFLRCDPFVKEDLGDQASCTTKLTADFDTQLSTPGTSLTQAQLDSCSANLKSAACDLAGTALPECQFKGTLGP